MKQRITFSLDPELLTWIDQNRGQKPRSTFVNEVLNYARDKDTKNRKIGNY